MKLHNLKIKPDYLRAILEGRKTFELRENDRNFQVGDLIHFTDTYDKEYLDVKDNVYIITYVLKDVKEFGLVSRYAILGIRPMKVVNTYVD